MALDGKNLAAKSCQNSGLVTGTGADLEDTLPGAELQLLGHQRHHIGLADRLPLADRQGHILVRLIFERRGDELLPRRLFNGAQYPRVGDAGTPQLHQQAQFLLDQARLCRAGTASRHRKTSFSEARTGTLVRLR